MQTIKRIYDQLDLRKMDNKHVQSLVEIQDLTSR